MKYLLRYTLKNEIQYAKKIISNLEWFIRNGYKIKLPKGININSTENEIRNAVIKEFSINKKKFDKIKLQLNQSIKKHQKTINNFFSYFGYNIPQKINIYFTNYGPGGAYFPPDKAIIMIKGSAEWILQMIVHETIHIIIEKPFIKKYNISHWEKEAIVDILCKSSILKDICSNYKWQSQTATLQLKFLEKLNFEKKSSLIKRQGRN